MEKSPNKKVEQTTNRYTIRNKSLKSDLEFCLSAKKSGETDTSILEVRQKLNSEILRHASIVAKPKLRTVIVSIYCR